MDRTLVVVSAGLSQPSSTRLLADRLAAATRDELARLDIRAEPHSFELRNLAHDITNHLLTGFPSEPLGKAIDAVSAADGLIAVTPVFNASYSGLFKSFLDVLDGTSLVDKPVLIAATGGTARHSLALEHALRPVFAYLRAVVVPTSVYAASEDWAAAQRWAGSTDGDSDLATTEDVPSPDGGPVPSGDVPLHGRIHRAARELAVEMSRREPTVVADPFALTTSFEDLVAGS
jgi:FMN reductase